MPLQGFGDTATNIFVREAQLAWPELFPFADDRLLEMCAKHGLPSSSAKDIAELVDNDRSHHYPWLVKSKYHSAMCKLCYFITFS